MHLDDKKRKLDAIAEEIRNCRKCLLWKTRTNPVPGEGNPDAKIMFIGEAPGRNEDLQGRPFVGSAGKLLTKMIEDYLRLSRDDVFITNVVKCRPPKNRDPTQQEIALCSPYLDRQIEIIMPDIIVCLGRHSARYILSKVGVNFGSILGVRGKIYNLRVHGKTISVIVTIHPAAVLYKKPWEKYLVEDFKLIKYVLERGNLDKKITLYDFF